MGSPDPSPSPTQVGAPSTPMAMIAPTSDGDEVIYIAPYLFDEMTRAFYFLGQPPSIMDWALELGQVLKLISLPIFFYELHLLLI